MPVSAAAVAASQCCKGGRTHTAARTTCNVRSGCTVQAATYCLAGGSTVAACRRCNGKGSAAQQPTLDACDSPRALEGGGVNQGAGMPRGSGLPAFQRTCRVRNFRQASRPPADCNAAPACRHQSNIAVGARPPVAGLSLPAPASEGQGNRWIQKCGRPARLPVPFGRKLKGMQAPRRR